MKFCCIDDDGLFLSLFKNFIIKYSIQWNLDIKTINFMTVPLDIPNDIDAFFLDVEIGRDTIFSFIERIRENNLLVPIIIISNHDIHIFNTVKYNIFDYIRKDKIEKDLPSTLDRLMKFIDKALPSITICYNGIVTRIKINDIKYVKLESHFTKIFTTNVNYEICKDMSSVFKDKLQFLIKIHRSYYINPIYLKHINRSTLILFDDIVLPIGKKYKNTLMEALLNYDF